MVPWSGARVPEVICLISCCSTPEGLPSDGRAMTPERVTAIMGITLAPPICLAFYTRC